MNVARLGRHQVAAFVASAADFAAMIVLASSFGLSPPIATVFSACFGGFVNFRLSRSWAFRAQHSGSLASQARRYLVVSLGGALLNGALLALFLRVAPMPYPIARVLVAVAVGLVYTYPLHTRVVFRVVG